MKFSNSLGSGYASRMNPAVPRTVFARLRASAWLPVLMVLVFVLNVGAAAACARHEFADLGLGGNSPHGTTVNASASDDPGALKQGAITQAGTCPDCGCHHAASTTLPDTNVAFLRAPQRLALPVSGLPPSAICRPELRPPIF